MKSNITVYQRSILDAIDRAIGARDWKRSDGVLYYTGSGINGVTVLNCPSRRDKQAYYPVRIDVTGPDRVESLRAAKAIVRELGRRANDEIEVLAWCGAPFQPYRVAMPFGRPQVTARQVLRFDGQAAWVHKRVRAAVTPAPLPR